ncbi:hypothetical protein CDAR_468921 [Caerostris darwini]|uniref:Uncharacterized protein n=1 Tax=Caerostris darwini TaxID=1538125 RepID=A0AAV4R335_9ARAC|nr:hypothetical protein CDAR_468921 [Caerostris darwini]
MPRSRMGLFRLEAYPLHFGGLTAATSANCGCLGRTIFEWRDLRSRGSRLSDGMRLGVLPYTVSDVVGQGEPGLARLRPPGGVRKWPGQGQKVTGPSLNFRRRFRDEILYAS